MFADSVIVLTKDIYNITYPALGYILKGYYFNRENQIQNSMENYSIAYNIAKKRGNINQQVMVSDVLIFYKSVWGNKKVALELQKERHKLLTSEYYFNEVKKATRESINIDVSQLYLEDEILSLQNFVYCYINLKQLDSAEVYLSMIDSKMVRYSGNFKNLFENWLDEAKVEVAYYNGQYEKAILLTDEILENEIANNSSLMNLYFFKGLSLIESHNYDIGIKYLKKSDSIYDLSRLSIPLQPYKRELFVRLLRHYESTKNKPKTIEYLNKLIGVDSIFKVNYQYFEPEHIKNFETPKLLQEKESVIASLERKNKRSATRTWWIGGILLGSLIIMSYYFNRQLVYKKRFQALQLVTNTGSDQNFRRDEARNEISSEIVEDILRKLNGFEEKRHFLVHDISLQSLARSFHTNSNYLSRVVNLKMEKNFSQYIHDLRIDYAMKELLPQPKFRNYTIKAIAEDCGYTNAESFSRAFYRKNRIYPSYYIKKLNKSAN